MSTHRMLMTALLLGAVGALSCLVILPATDAVPAAGRGGSPTVVAAPTALRGQVGRDTYTPPAGTFGAAAAGSARSPLATASATPAPGASFSSPAVASGAPATASAAPSATATAAASVLFPTAADTSTDAPGVLFPTASDPSSAAASASSSGSATAPASSGPATAPASSGSGTAFANGLGLGFYDGTSRPAGSEIAATWLGSSASVKYAQDFIDARDWSHISAPWQLPNWQGSPYAMVWGVPMLPCGAPATQCATNTADYDLVANGGADSYYVTLAQNLVAAGFGSSYIRLGWEFNADWMGWGICNSAGTGLASWAADFVPAFQNIVNSMRSVAGANFKFIWNPIDSANASCAGASLENFYPGDAYVDAVALDAYDGIGTQTSSDAARWTDILDGVNAGGWTAVTPAPINGQTFGGYGLTWLAAFAAEHGKEVSLPEWGLMSASTDGGGGDDTTYMTQMTAWIKSYASGPVLFWNYAGGTLPLNIPNYTNGGTPNATAVFQAAFAGGL